MWLSDFENRLTFMVKHILVLITWSDLVLLKITLPSVKMKYRISSNKRRSAYLIFMILGAALIRGRRLIEGGAYFEIWKFCS